MKYLFVHNNCPGQFIHLIDDLLKNKDEIVFLSHYIREEKLPESVTHIQIPTLDFEKVPFRSETEKTIHELFYAGEVFGNALMKLSSEGFSPDVIIAHAGWGGSIYIPDIFPNAAYIIYCEWFYIKGEHYYTVFSKDTPPSNFAVSRQRNLCQFDALNECNLAISPTRWQAYQYPDAYKNKIKVLHDGINSDFFIPKKLSNNNRTIQDLDTSEFTEIITYSSRGFEPYRGFPQFIKSIPQILQERPKAHIIIMGEDLVYYSSTRKDGKSWKTAMLEEVDFDKNRVHFLNFGTYEDYLKLLQISNVHVYLTVPFVLSWSLLEAMSCECLIVASNTTPVREVIKHEQNGILTSFSDSSAIAKAIIYSLESYQKLTHIKKNARKTILDKYSTHKTVPAYKKLIEYAIENKKLIANKS